MYRTSFCLLEGFEYRGTPSIAFRSADEVADGFAKIILICNGVAHLHGQTPAIAEALVRRVESAIRVIASTRLGYLRFIARSSKPEGGAVTDDVLRTLPSNPV